MTQGVIPPHGGYRNLLPYRKTEIVCDDAWFCDRYIERRNRTQDQRVQAARGLRRAAGTAPKHPRSFHDLTQNPARLRGRLA